MSNRLGPVLLVPVGPLSGTGGTPNPSYNVTGPSTGVALAASTNFTITGANLTGPVIITMASDDPGGTFTPSTRTIDVGSEVQTFTYTPDGSLGIHNLSWTNNGGLANPGGIAYDVTAVPSGGENYLLEDGSSAYLLEDGTSLLLLESSV